MKLHSKTRFAAALLATSIGLTAATGCKSVSSWKMPGMGMFSSAREPDASLLAGSTPEVEMPTSPANRYDPSTSVATTPQTSSATKSPYGGYASPSGYGATNSPVAGQTVSTPTGGGLAAKSNGYRVGPYQTAGQTTGQTAGASYTAPNTSTGTSPYGGTYGGKTTTPPSSAYTGMPPKQPETKVALPTYGANTIGPSTGSLGGSNPSQPSYPSLPAPGASPSLPTPTDSSADMPAFPPIPGTGSLPVSPPASTPALQAPLGGMAPPSSGSYAPGTTPSGGSYAPGTTSRTTPYDFSGAGSSGTSVLPPNTATAPGNTLLR